MTRKFLLFTALLGALCSLTNCKNKNEDEKKYKQSVKEWRQKRLENLKAEDGWLNLAGLLWLEKGKNTIGSAAENNIQFPKKAPAHIGSITIKDTTIKFQAAEGTKVTHNNQPVEKITMNTDREKNTTLLTHGSFKWFIIEREGRLAIRLRDLESPLINQLDSIPAYPVQPEWKVKAEFVPFEEEKTVEVPNVLGGVNEEQVPGALKFTIEGKEYELYPLGNRKSMFLIFADETNAEETYGGGRFLSVSGPGEDNITYIDFNKAYNPPCAFTPYATCPLPPRENILPIKITAGEKAPGIEVPHH